MKFRPLEKVVLRKVTQYIKTAFPNLIYRVDVGADIKLSIGQAKANKAVQMKDRGYPDIHIAKAKKGYHGLYIELKRDQEEIYKKDGTYKKNEHLEEQIKMHERLREEGYLVLWGLGFNDTIKKIREYLG